MKRKALHRALRAEVAPSALTVLMESFVSPAQNMEESSAAGSSAGDEPTTAPTTTRPKKG